MNKKRAGSMLLILLLVILSIHVFAKKTDYSRYSNSTVEFGLKLKTDHKAPGYEKPGGVKLSRYNTYVYDKYAAKKHKKVIYLTFDCGYENGYTRSILKTLKKNKVKAIFFVTERYIKKNPSIVKQMKKDGHLVGNHTCNHPRLTDLPLSEMKKEVSQCAKTMKKKTGYKMDKYMRPPEGAYSVRVMKVMKDMGYSTMLWSLAYYDYDPKDEQGANYVVEKFEKHHFCGMMPLMHVISRSNRDALPRVISYLKKEGYRFGQVSDFVMKPQKK